MRLGGRAFVIVIQVYEAVSDSAGRRSVVHYRATIMQQTSVFDVRCGICYSVLTIIIYLYSTSSHGGL